MGVPVARFGTGMAMLLPLLGASEAGVIGFDWRRSRQRDQPDGAPLDSGWQQLGEDVAVQGNLGPVALVGPRPELERRVWAILALAGGRPGHSFSLGHGILPTTPLEQVRAVDMVHEVSIREAA